MEVAYSLLHPDSHDISTKASSPPRLHRETPDEARCLGRLPRSPVKLTVYRISLVYRSVSLVSGVQNKQPRGTEQWQELDQGHFEPCVFQKNINYF